jgi:signal peptidase II
MKAKYLFFAILFVIAFGLDQWTKVWARKELKPRGYDNAVTVVSGFFDMRYSENTGSAFGLFRGTPGARYFLFGVGILCLGVIGMWLYKAPKQAPWLGAKLGLLAGGAVGNIVDRAIYGRVTDFVVWKVSRGGRIYEWPTFNIADAALVIGVGLLLLDWPRDPVFNEMPPDGDDQKSPA